jgi:hypothetical protein
MGLQIKRSVTALPQIMFHSPVDDGSVHPSIIERIFVVHFLFVADLQLASFA